MPVSHPPAKVLFALLLLLPASGIAQAGLNEPPEGRAALEAARAAYQAARPFQESLDLTLELPDGRREPRRQVYGMSRSGGTFFRLESNGREALRIVARNGRMVATQTHVAGLYAEGPYHEDFAAALRGLGGAQESLVAPPAIVAAQGGDLDAFLSALQMGVLEPLHIVAVRRAEDAAPVVEVDFQAANGRATVGLDAASHRLREIHIALGEGARQVRASGLFHFTSGEPEDAALTWPELAGRTAVSTLAEMEKGTYPLGQPAPDVTLPSLGGGPVRLADLRGSVIVLDFWATWCVPCWKALEHTSELAAWAKSRGLAVRVFALNTLENTEDSAEQKRRVSELLQSRKLDLPVLLDEGHTAFSAFHSPGLPSIVIIGRDGRLAQYHSGLLPDMTATLQSEVQELLGPPGAGGR